jgi:hypothetical protein
MIGRVHLCAAALMVAAGGASVSAQPPPDAVEQAAIRLGPFGINPSVVVRDVGIDDNVFNESRDPKRDFTFTLTPRADVLFRAGSVRTTITTATDYVYYETYESERGANQLASVRFDIDLGRLQPYAMASGANTRERLNREVDARARHRTITYTGGLSVRIASRTSLGAAVRRTTMRFDDGTAFRGIPLDESFDSRTDAVEGSFDFELTPLTTFRLVGERAEQAFDLQPARNSRSYRLGPMLTFSPLGLLNGSASVGYRRFEPNDPLLVPYSGLVANVGLTALIAGRHKLETAFNRDVQYSYERQAPYYLSTGGSATWTTQVTSTFDVRVTGARQRLRYRGDVVELGGDTFTSYGGGIGVRLAHRVRLGLDALRTERTSDRAAEREYRSQRLFASFTWGASS